MRTKGSLTSIAAAALLAGPAIAQEQQAEGQETQIAEQCFEELRSFGQRIQEDGYWLTGVRDRWGAGAWGGGAPGTAYYPGVGVPGGMTTTEGTTAGTADAVNPPAWGLGIQSPGMQIETLFRGAQVLAVRGDQEGCEAVLSELTQLYDEYVSTLREAGVDPNEVTSWRQEMMVAAEPVDQLAVDRFSVDQVTEAEVRNFQDEYLGDIEDVLIQEGEIQHVVISRGGFLGLGEDHRVVPWDALSATPNMNLFLLDVPEEALEEGPAVSTDVRELTDEQRAQVNEYWEQRGTDQN